MSWLFNRDKTLEQLETAYYKSIKEDTKEAVLAAFEAEPLDPTEREELAGEVDGHDDRLGAKLIELMGVGIRLETFDEHANENAESAVTYTADVALMLLLTSNQDAYEDEIGETAPTDEARAAFAYTTDMREFAANEYAMADIARVLLGLGQES